MRKVKKFICLLCCMALIVSTAIDVRAAEELGGLQNEMAVVAQTTEDGGEGTREILTLAGTQEEEKMTGGGRSI